MVSNPPFFWSKPHRFLQNHPSFSFGFQSKGCDLSIFNPRARIHWEYDAPIPLGSITEVLHDTHQEFFNFTPNDNDAPMRQDTRDA